MVREMAGQSEHSSKKEERRRREGCPPHHMKPANTRDLGAERKAMGEIENNVASHHHNPRGKQPKIERSSHKQSPPQEQQVPKLFYAEERLGDVALENKAFFGAKSVPMKRPKPAKTLNV